ncbi:class I lanthipeptide [uncultured Kordia sp.]|uniref:class I lanthipeptide n=1 Tax=uncultured Kordia sp. TaxID=507699 RepID=UPI002623C635|nr:class I lanthipeptide [uncultured Kordia sp.]
MKKQRIKKSLSIKKSNIAKLNNKEMHSVLGGSTSIVPRMCRSINPLECATSAGCPRR